jgi:hypothetical protein
MTRGALPLLAAAATASLLAACGSGTPAAHASQPTRIVYVSPVSASGAAASGYRTASTATRASCTPGSEAIGQAYRCFAGNYVYDPCWAEKAATPTVLCVPDPWSRTDARLGVSGGLAAIPNEGAVGEPWGVELQDGKRCVLFQGAHSAFRGATIDYDCGPSLSLLHGLRKGSGGWVARSVVTDKSGHMSAGPNEKIAIAWFGSPVRYR